MSVGAAVGMAVAGLAMMLLGHDTTPLNAVVVLAAGFALALGVDGVVRDLRRRQDDDEETDARPEP